MPFILARLIFITLLQSEHCVANHDDVDDLDDVGGGDDEGGGDVDVDVDDEGGGDKAASKTT